MATLPLAIVALVAPAFALDAPTVASLKSGTVLLRVTQGEGSGFFVDETTVVTNEHVVRSAGEGGSVRVVLDSGTRGSVTLDGTVRLVDAALDLAVVTVPPTPGRALTLRPELPVETEDVVAVGFPLGSLRAFGVGQSDPPVSLRPGAVTAIHRSPSGEVAYIEHNTNMQEGSSGGPLVNARGEVVGVNVAIMSRDATTKLAIPGRAAVTFLARARKARATPARVAESASRPTNTTAIFVAPFAEGRVREAAAAGGNLYVLLTDGSVRVWKDDAWSSTRSGTNNRDLAVDDQTGAVYVVEEDSGHLYRLGSTGWALEGDGVNRSAAASGGTLWTLDAEGSLMVRPQGGKWNHAGLTGIDDVKACGTGAFLRADTTIWAHDGSALTNEGEPLRTDVRDLACERDHAYAVMSDGKVVDFSTSRVIDSATDNVAVYALETGVIARTSAGTLWYWSREDDGWTRLAR
jgi:S1-C subfamily serine protease